MKYILMLGGMLMITPALTSPAFAAGCVKGAVVGGVVGHFAGHHGLAGAAAGCVIGHHEANKRMRDDDARYSRDDDRHDNDHHDNVNYPR